MDTVRISDEDFQQWLETSEKLLDNFGNTLEAHSRMKRQEFELWQQFSAIIEAVRFGLRMDDEVSLH